MILQAIDEQKTSYFEALVPQSEADHTLLRVLLDQELDWLLDRRVVGKNSVMRRTEFGSDGETTLELNIMRGQKLHRLCLQVRVCIFGVWDGEREDRVVRGVTKHPETNEVVTLYYLLRKFLDVEQPCDDEEDDSASDDALWSS